MAPIRFWSERPSMFAFIEALVLLANPAALREMKVPAQIAAISTNPEPSAVIWSAQLQRYLVVSDDTGLRERGTYHAPWLFTMNAKGELDAEPLRIEGIESLQ